MSILKTKLYASRNVSHTKSYSEYQLYSTTDRNQHPKLPEGEGCVLEYKLCKE